MDVVDEDWVVLMVEGDDLELVVEDVLVNCDIGEDRVDWYGVDWLVEYTTVVDWIIVVLGEDNKNDSVVECDEDDKMVIVDCDVENDWVGCLFKYTSDVDSGMEVTDDVWVVLMEEFNEVDSVVEGVLLDCDIEGDCCVWTSEGEWVDFLVEYIIDADGAIEVVDEVSVVWFMEGDAVDCLIEYASDVDGGTEVFDEVWVVWVVEGDEVDCTDVDGNIEVFDLVWVVLMVEGDKVDFLVEYTTDVDGGIEFLDEIGVVWMVEDDEVDCLVEYAIDVEGGIEVIDEVSVVSVVEGEKENFLVEYATDVVGSIEDFDVVWVVLMV